jgi:dTDP-4-dehydrorhamnose reductase
MTLLVFGKTGQVAQALAALRPDAIYVSRNDVDLAMPGQITDMILGRRPSAIINAAAYTAVDKAETDEPLATRINGDAPGIMAMAAARLNCPLIQISTDYVFAGSGIAAHRPDDPVAPLGAYGRSKLKGELAVRAAGGTHAILRTSWVFSGTGTNFVLTMLRLAQDRDELAVVADQVGAPTPASDIARTCLTMVGHLLGDPDKSGTYHYAGTPDVSWAEFAREIFAQAGLRTQVTDIPARDYPVAAPRPANSRLDCTTLRDVFGIERSPWAGALAAVIAKTKKAGQP